MFQVGDRLIFKKSGVEVTVVAVFSDGYGVEKDNGERMFATETWLSELPWRDDELASWDDDLGYW
jgi:hypothetical protein